VSTTAGSFGRVIVVALTPVESGFECRGETSVAHETGVDQPYSGSFPNVDPLVIIDGVVLWSISINDWDV